MCVSVVKYNGSASKISLTESLSALEGKSEALGAGAKIIANYSGMLPEKDILRLEKSNTEIVLFSDGYEHGNEIRRWIKILAKRIGDFLIIACITCKACDTL